jgi:hypothetical protein
VDISGLGAHQLAILNPGATDGFDIGGVPEVGSLLNMDAVVGSGSADTLTGLNAIAFWFVTGPDAGFYDDPGLALSLDFASVEGLTGGSDADIFTFAGGSLSGPIAGGGGFNRLQGDDSGRTFPLFGLDKGAISGILPVGFSGIQELFGGAGADILAVLPGGSLTGFFSGLSGFDTADFSAAGSQQFVVMSVNATGEFDLSDLPTIGGGLLSIENLIGSAAGTADKLIGLDEPTTWQISGPNSGAYIDDGLGVALAFSNIENLTDGSASATLQLLPGGSLSGVFDAGAGSDTLDLSALSGQQVQITGPSAIDGFDLVPILPIAGGFADIDRIIGSSKSLTDRLTGWNGPVTWQVKAGTDQNVYTDNGTGHTLFFSGFDQLFGGSDSDSLTVDFSAGIPILSLGLTFNGQGGTDSLNVIGTGAVDLFRLTNTALRVNGRPIRYGNVETIQMLGGAGKDVFSSPSATLPGVLSAVSFFGEDGDDTAVVTPTLYSLLHVDGGAGKDTLKIARGAAISIAPLPPRGVLSGTYLFKNRKGIEFDGVEVRAIGASQVFP